MPRHVKSVSVVTDNALMYIFMQPESHSIPTHNPKPSPWIVHQLQVAAQTSPKCLPRCTNTINSICTLPPVPDTRS